MEFEKEVSHIHTGKWAWHWLNYYVKKMGNVCQFTIVFNRSYNYLKKNLAIFHYIKAQIRETHNYGYQQQ